MRRGWLVGTLVVSKGMDATSTIAALSLASDLRETVPLARALIEAFGLVGGTLVLTAVSVVVVVALAEGGRIAEQMLPETTPEWYVPMVRSSVYLVCAACFASAGLLNLLWLL